VIKGTFLIYFVVAALMLILIGGLISGISLNDKNDAPPITDIVPDEAVTEEVPPKKDVTPSVVIPPGEPVGPAFRESVIVYFEEMPGSLEDFASQYGVKLIFAHEEIKMAAFETNPTSRSAQTSQITLDFINKASKDFRVEKAYKDGILFIRSDKTYTQEPEITYLDDLEKQGVERGNILNKIRVGFWRFPPSLKDFADRHGGKLVNFDDANEALLYASFETSNITGFLENVSVDPYVRSASPDASYYSLAS